MSNKAIDDIIVLHPTDNIGVSRRRLAAGESVQIQGTETHISEDIPVGHKVALMDITAHSKILKYGAPIGSAIADIKAGHHVHLHNMKSDYIASHTREAVSHQGH